MPYHDGSWRINKRREIIGPGPHRCFFCHKKIVGKYEVHHIDGDHSNDVPSNLSAAHGSCHRVHHMPSNFNTRGRKLTPEHKAAISKANMGNQHTKGRKLTMEHRQKISAAFQRRREAKEKVS